MLKAKVSTIKALSHATGDSARSYALDRVQVRVEDGHTIYTATNGSIAARVREPIPEATEDSQESPQEGTFLVPVDKSPVLDAKPPKFGRYDSRATTHEHIVITPEDATTARIVRTMPTGDITQIANGQDATFPKTLDGYFKRPEKELTSLVLGLDVLQDLINVAKGLKGSYVTLYIPQNDKKEGAVLDMCYADLPQEGEAVFMPRRK